MHINFKLSDGQKYEQIWQLLNPNYDEEHGWAVDYSICDVYDEYIVVHNHEANIFERIYYKKEDDKVCLGERMQVYIIDVTAEEKATLETLQLLNGGSYAMVNPLLNDAAATENELAAVKEQVGNYEAQISELQNAAALAQTEHEEAIASVEAKFNAAQEYESQVAELNNTIASLEEEKNNYASQCEEATNKNSELDSKIVELNNSISTLNSDMQTVVAEYQKCQDTITALENTVHELEAYKYNVELQQKESVINEYVSILNEEVLNSYREKIDTYTVIDLDKELAYELKKNNMAAFNLEKPVAVLPKDTHEGGLKEILSRYVK